MDFFTRCIFGQPLMDDYGDVEEEKKKKEDISFGYPLSQRGIWHAMYSSSTSFVWYQV